MGEDVRLCGKRVLVVEDEFFIADDLARGLAAMGAEVVGPAATVEQALHLLDGEPRLDGAVLDIKLRGALGYPVADKLLARDVPVVFASGYDADVIPTRFVRMPRCVKPASSKQVAALLMTAFVRTPPGAQSRLRPRRRQRIMDARVLARRRRIRVLTIAT